MKNNTLIMFLFGVTGGIGCGKTTVCNFLREKGIPVIEADPLAKELTNHLPEICQALTNEFGKEVYTKEGELNTEKLSNLVFSNSNSRERVNQIIHPHVIHHIQKEAHRLHADENHKLVGVEAALIYESKMQKILNAVVVVTAPLEKRIQWLQKRNNFSRAEIQQRIESQMPLTEKAAQADYVIENDSNLAELKKRVIQFYLWLQSKEKS